MTWRLRSEEEPPKDCDTWILAHNPDEWACPKSIRWSDLGNFYCDNMLGVVADFTHWLPLPPLPTEKESK